MEAKRLRKTKQTQQFLPYTYEEALRARRSWFGGEIRTVTQDTGSSPGVPFARSRAAWYASSQSEMKNVQINASEEDDEEKHAPQNKPSSLVAPQNKPSSPFHTPMCT